MSRRFLVLLPAMALLGACVADGPPRSYYGGTYYDRGGYYDRSDAYRDGWRRRSSDGYHDRRGYYHRPAWNAVPPVDPNPPGP